MGSIQADLPDAFPFRYRGLHQLLGNGLFRRRKRVGRVNDRSSGVCCWSPFSGRSTGIHRDALACVVVLGLVVLPVSARAQQRPVLTEPEQPPPKPSHFTTVAQHGVTEDWGPRARLAAHGVKLEAVLTAEPSVNDRGHSGHGVVYAQQFEFGVTIDTKKVGITPGTFRLVLFERAGKPVQALTGSYFQNQHVYGQGEIVRLSEISYERFLVGKTVSVKGGFYPMGNDFGALPYTCNLTDGAHCAHPASLPDNSGWQDPPTGAWGGRLKIQATSRAYVQFGLYDVTPDRKLSSNGFNLGFPHTTGMIAPLEIGYDTGKTPYDYPGTLKFGIYYDSSRVPDVAVPTRDHKGRGGIYLEAAKQVWKVRPSSVQGLAVFGVATLNDAATALFRSYYEAGLSFRGPLDRRGDDIISLGWARADINDRLSRAQREAGKPIQSSEQLVELNYGAQLTRWLIVRPAIQYVIRPGASTARPNVAVFTLHVQASL